jgi:adenine-specific DNA-methyltransferase
MHKQNMLLFGDNLLHLQKLAHNSNVCGQVDLIYIDPPFATGLDFFVAADGRATTISSSGGAGSAVAYGDKFSLDEYLTFMRPRLELLHKLLSTRGSLYLHIDSGRVHYVKILLDEIFGIENFRADITRIKCNPKNFKRANYGNIKDHILFYSKSTTPIWNDVQENVNDDDLARRFGKVDNSGRAYTTVPLHAPGETKNGATGSEFMGQLPPIGRHWRYTPDKLLELYQQGLIETSSTGNMRLKVFQEDKTTKKIQDVWSFKDPQTPLYPTQKNDLMLAQIILNSSHPDSLVLDCFCGSGGTLLAAQNLGRCWIGIDQSPAAIKVIKRRLAADMFTQYTYKELKEEPLHV